jgi:hypothetical protein
LFRSPAPSLLANVLSATPNHLLFLLVGGMLAVLSMVYNWAFEYAAPQTNTEAQQILVTTYGTLVTFMTIRPGSKYRVKIYDNGGLDRKGQSKTKSDLDRLLPGLL